MYHNLEELCACARKERKPVWQIVLENEMKCFGRSENEIFAALKERQKKRFPSLIRQSVR